MQTASIQDVCDLVVDCPHSTPIWTTDGALVFRSNNIRNGRLDLSQRSFTTEAEYMRRVGRAVPSSGDVIITREAPMGEVALIPPGVRGCLGQRMVLLRPKPGVMDGRFLVYALMSPRVQHEIGTHDGSGSTVSNLRIPVLKALQLPCPPLRTQWAIADVLGTLDDKIELNRQTAETLDALAQSLFRSWFIDFDPVRAKFEGRAPAALTAEAAKIFPQAFEQSAFGPIPKGWKAGEIGHCVSLKRGTTYAGPLVGKPGPALLGLGSIRPGGGFRSNGFKTYGGDCPSELMLRPGDLYVSLKGATKDGEMIGSVARLPITVPSGRLTQDTVKLEFLDASLARYMYRLLLTREYRTYCANRATGSAVVALSRTDFLSYPLVRPAATVLECFNDVVGALESRSEQLAAESARLSDARDELLPALLSGQVRGASIHVAPAAIA